MSSMLAAARMAASRPGKTTFQLLLAQGIHVSNPHHFGPDKPRLAQHRKMVGDGGFWPSILQRSAGLGLTGRKLAHHCQPERVGQGVKQAGQLHILRQWVVILLHDNCLTCLFPCFAR
jgi:hypothetical protein